MPIPLPDLDDRRYDDLVEEIVNLIPRYAPAWTDHNASDPGIMLIELFSFLFEAMMYRQNRVTEQSRRTFLKLLNGRLDGASDPMAGLSLKQAEARTILNLRARYRAVTADDFESLVLAMDEPNMARVQCLPGLNLAGDNPEKPCEGHVSLILVPFAAKISENGPVPSAEDLSRVSDYLDSRRLITTKIHVVGPVYVPICVDMTVTAGPKESASLLKARVNEALRRFFHPLSGGVEGRGWPFGRAVYASEVYQRVEGLAGVDHVDSLTLYIKGKGGFMDSGRVIPIGPNALVDYEEKNIMNRIRILNSHG